MAAIELSKQARMVFKQLLDRVESGAPLSSGARWHSRFIKLLPRWEGSRCTLHAILTPQTLRGGTQGRDWLGCCERDEPVFLPALREFKTKRCRVLAFQTPPSTRLYHGIDWCGGAGGRAGGDGAMGKRRGAGYELARREVGVVMREGGG